MNSNSYFEFLLLYRLHVVKEDECMQYVGRDENLMLLRVYGAKMGTGFRQEQTQPIKRVARKEEDNLNFTDMFNSMVGKAPVVV